MKILLALLLALVPAAARAQNTGFTPRPVADTLAAWLLSQSEEVEIEDGDDSFLLRPRLYGVWEQGSCVEDTHMSCSARYYLAVSEDGAAPRVALFELGSVGEVLSAKVDLANGLEDPRLLVSVLNYPDDVFQYAPNLVRERRVYHVDFDLDSVRIIPAPSAP
jgi:hypothetical protein